MSAAYLFAFLLAIVQMGALVASVFVAVALAARTRRAAVLWMLAVITNRRLPLAIELEALGEGLWASDRWKLNAAAGRVRAGATLAEALSATPGLVPEDTVVLAHVGERSDRIGEMLSSEAARLARIREAALAPTTSPSLALLYLVAIPLVIPTILTGLMIFIIPKYKKIFSDFGVQLPWVTRELVASSDFVAKFWYLAFASVILAVTIAGILLVLSRVYAWDVRLPRRMSPGAQSRRTSLTLRAIAIAAAGDRPMSDALDPLANASRSGLDRWKFDRLRTRYREGGDLWSALAAERFVSSRDAALLAAAQRAGNLPWALEMLADRFDDARRRRLATILEIVQPAVVLALGALVLFICLGMFLPLINLLSALG